MPEHERGDAEHAGSSLPSPESGERGEVVSERYEERGSVHPQFGDGHLKSDEDSEDALARVYEQHGHADSDSHAAGGVQRARVAAADVAYIRARQDPARYVRSRE